MHCKRESSTCLPKQAKQRKEERKKPNRKDMCGPSLFRGQNSLEPYQG